LIYWDSSLIIQEICKHINRQKLVLASEVGQKYQYIMSISLSY
jgi:hypothetical protein